MANKSGRRLNSMMVSIIIVVALAIVFGALVGAIYFIFNNPDTNNDTSSITTSIDDTSSNIVSSDESSSNTPSVEASSQVPSTNTSSTVSQSQKPDDDAKIVYLTFDDGPSKNTLKLLDTLDELGVKATFFVVGNAVNAYPEYLTEIVRRGHAIGLHAYQHEYGIIYKSEQAYFEDLQKISDLVYNWTGIRPNIMRFPGGSSNAVSKNHCVGIMTLLTQKVPEKGYYYFDWNVDSGDATKLTAPVEEILESIKSYSLKNKINLLMHDTYYKTTTIEALPEIVEYYRSHGYEFGVLDENSPEFHHRVNN